MSRSMRSRSFSWCSRAISAAWSAGIGVACVVERRATDAGSCVRGQSLWTSSTLASSTLLAKL
ncbi:MULTISPECIES: hypothetical protein [unclassified Bradyrhizobium]|uniref:hypothetical protein n=1 Tax=unclassified Bradyrhizobium TaxID=2631580 RepID=UPI002FF15393